LAKTARSEPLVNPFLPDAVQQLVRLFSRFPSIGERSALRLVLFLLRQHESFRAQLSMVLNRLGDEVGFCPICRALSNEGEPCVICRNPEREAGSVCLVEGVADLIAVEQSGQFTGRYHVLHGVLSPMKGIGPDEIGLSELSSRVSTEEIDELILATNMSVEGEATAAYIGEFFADRGVRITRIAAGIPMGGNLEFLDGLTIGNAFRERREL
jgi:recombination protein RecR